MSVAELRALGLNVIPMDLQAKLTPVVRGVKRLKWGIFNGYRPIDKCIRAWEVMFPGHTWGVVTGPISGVFVLDVDGEKGKAALRALGVELPPTWVSKTQNSGLHYYYVWDNCLNALPTTKVGIVDGVDIRGKGGYVVSYPWVEGCSPKDVPLAPIPKWLMAMVSTKPVEVRNKPGWISELLDDPTKLGRHQSFAKIIGRFNSDGLAAEDIYKLLLPHWVESGLPAEELLSQTRNMTRRYAGQAAQPLKGLSSKELLSTASVKHRWLVDSLFPREGVGIIAGHAKIGKSWLTLDLAITVAKGGLWLSKFLVEPGHVLYVDEESSRDLLGYRYRKLLNQKEYTDANIQFVSKEGFTFSSQSKIDELRQVMDLLHPKLVVFDSLNRVHSANENSASEMGEVFRAVTKLSKDYGCFILFTDHLPYGQDRFRGSSDKAAFVDAGFLASKIGNSNIMLEHKYARLTDPVRSFELSIMDEGPEKTLVRWVG
jgi:hypothetical protein